MRSGVALFAGQLGAVLGAMLLGLPLAFADMIRSGYIQDIQAEKEEQYYEVYMSPPSVSMEAADLRAKIFNTTLTTEFRDRWEQRFGYIDTASMNFAAERFTNVTENRGTPEDQQRLQDRRAFGEYMIKRLGEWHLDNYFKSDPNLRPVYEMKEQLSNVQVAVTEETKMRVNYALSDNSVEAVVDNPYVDTKVRVEMDPKQLGPASIIENWLYFGKRLTQKLYFLTSYATQDGMAQVELQRSHSSGLYTSYRASTTTTAVGRTPRQSFFGYALHYLF